MQQVSHKHIVLLYGVCVHHQESKCILEAVWLCNEVLIPVAKVFDTFLFVYHKISWWRSLSSWDHWMCL